MRFGRRPNTKKKKKKLGSFVLLAGAADDNDDDQKETFPMLLAASICWCCWVLFLVCGLQYKETPSHLHFFLFFFPLP
jgi:hypothetical protein